MTCPDSSLLLTSQCSSNFLDPFLVSAGGEVLRHSGGVAQESGRIKMTMTRLTIMCGLALLLTGCGRKTDAPPPPQPEAHAPVPVAVSAVSNSTPPAALPLPPAANLDAELAQLTRELRKWIVRHQRPPSSFEEFTANAPFQVPAPPAGKKFAISKQMRVVVVNR